MAGYHIIHIENKWIVCFEQTRLISFDRKWKALKIMHTAAGLLKPQICDERNVLPADVCQASSTICKNVWSNRGRSG